MASLIIINSAPNLSAWERKVERTRALSHTGEISYRNKKNTKSLARKLNARQGKFHDDDRSAGSFHADVAGADSLQVVPAHHDRPDRYFHSNYYSAAKLNKILRNTSTSRTIEDVDEEEEVYPMFGRARMEEYMSQNIFSNDFGCFRGMRTEPFGIISELASPAIDYYSQVVVPSFSAVWKIFDVNSMVPQALFELLDTKVCVMAMILPPRVITDSSWYPGKRVSESFLRAYNLALSRIRQRIDELGGKADPPILLAVNSLAILAGAMGDIASFKVHAQSLGSLLQSAGGFENLGRFHFIKSLLLQWESQWAYNPSMRVTLYPDAREKYVACFPSFPFSPEVSKLVSKLPIGFQRLAERQLLSVRTLEILARCADVSTGDMPLYQNTQEQFHPEQRRFADFFEACPCIAPGAEDPPPLEKFVVQALILYCHHTWSPLRFQWALYKATRMDLTMELLGRPLSGDHEKDVMVWIYMNLIDSWQTVEGSGRLTPEGKGIFFQLEDIFCGIIQDEDVKQIIQQTKLFFWTDKFERRCRRCLGVALAERKAGPV